MLGPGRYLLGAAELLLLTGLAALGAAAVRRLLAPSLTGAPAALATAICALALLLLPAQALGTFGLLKPLPCLLLVAALSATAQALARTAGAPAASAGAPAHPSPGDSPAGGWRGGGRRERTPRPQASPAATGPTGPERPRPNPSATPAPTHPERPRPRPSTTALALALAAFALLHFAWQAKARLGTGMTGFDTTWYHGPLAAGFAQSGDTWQLHFIAPQFLAWFYPANAELFHALGILAFDRDLLSPLLNLGWFAGCLLACWCLGRPFGVAPWSLALGAVALSLPALHDQAGEARNDIVGTFCLLAGAAVAVNAWGAVGARRGGDAGGGGAAPAPWWGAPALCGLAAGMAAGTKLNFLLPAATLVAGLAWAAPRGVRLRALGVLLGAALLGGGYWYLRNLFQAGNPLPWFDSLGPLALPAPDQALGGREAHSVAGYLLDGAVWSEWLLPGLRAGLTLLWPAVLLAAAAGLLGAAAALPAGRARPRSARERALATAGAAGLAAALAWLIAPTSASGPEGVPRGFESGLRYLAPALVLGLALLPAAVAGLRARTPAPSAPTANPERLRFVADKRTKVNHHTWRGVWVGIAAALVAVALGYPVQRHYLEHRYADPTFAAPGLNAAFAWARDVSGARIATTATRQYPLLGTDLSNRVRFVGERRPHGGFVAPTGCPAWRRLLAEGRYEYVVASLDRLGEGRRYPAAAGWTAGPESEVVLRRPPTVVFRLRGPLDPAACRR